MDLTVSSFFSTYINHPLSNDLTVRDRVKATIASIAIGILTIGLAQLICSKVSERRVKKIIAFQREKGIAMAQLGMPVVYASDAAALVGALPCGSLGDGAIAQHVQEALISPYYARPLPKAEQVVVPLPEGGKARWVSLSAAQKIKVNNHHTHPHNQVKENSWGMRFIDKVFMPGGQAPYLTHDPREHHGSDHAARMTVFTPVFAYLYAKYHPKVSAVTPSDVVLAQFIGAGHDCARQTEGPDVYDEDSSQATIDALSYLGVNDLRVVELARRAIAEKDSPPSDEKPLIARIVQNADCAEFARLLLPGPVQELGSFQNSVRYLDIYKELTAIAEKNGGKLKGSCTFKQFEEELEVVRWEMNRLIHETHQRAFRAKASRPGTNYVDMILGVIDREKYPLLNRILKEMRVQTLDDPRKRTVHKK